MKKIIAAFDGLNFSEGTLESAIYFTKHANAHLVGIFLDDFTHHSYRFAEVLDEEGGISDVRLQELDSEDKQTRDWSAQLFEEACREAGIKYSIHRDQNIAVQELLHESVYADLLIIDKKENFGGNEKQVPSSFLQDLLTDVQCPVLVVPTTYKKTEKIVLLYDGEPSSVHAIKMFSYMLPLLKSERVEVLTINSDKEEVNLPDSWLMKEFMKRHFPFAEYIVLTGEPEKEITEYLQNEGENVLVVLGAYRRGRVSRWFKQSMADHIMQHVDLPLFIAHNK